MISTRPAVTFKAQTYLIILATFALLLTVKKLCLRISPHCELPEDPPIPALYGTIYSAHTERDWLRTSAEYRKAGLRVPNLIHQTVKLKNNKDLGKSWRMKNPGWIHVVWDDADIMNFVTDVHPHLLPIINALETPVEKTDLWRYLVLYTYGGVYADQDAECEKPISKWPWSPCTSLIAAVEGQCDEGWRQKYLMTGYNQFQQWFLASRPGHPLMRRAVEIVRENVERERDAPYPYQDKRLRILFRTGPGAWSDAVNDFLRTTGYRDFDVIDGGIDLGDVAFFPLDSFRNQLVMHNFEHSWHDVQKIDPYSDMSEE
ncbi:nucleotide-diphospho-sugar transferase [Phlyctochytrium arcticum]|nr:nucleotide-diphospho-sugar transferase [Phlyctochytrium arcticum]